MPARRARHRLVGGTGDRRVPARASSTICRRRDRLARRAAVVQRAGRHVRLQLLGFQLAAGWHASGRRRWTRSARSTRPTTATPTTCTTWAARCGPSTSSTTATTWSPMNALPPVPALFGRGVARRVAGTRRRARAVVAALVEEQTRRAVLAARFACGPDYDRIECADDDRRRLGRRLSQQHLPHVRAALQCEKDCSSGRGATWRRRPRFPARTSTSCRR